MLKPLSFVLFLTTSLILADGPYRPPNMEKEIFHRRKLDIDQITKTALFSGLICVARDFDEKTHKVNFDLRSNALAIAGRLDPTSETFKEVAADLEASGHTLMDGSSTKADIAAKIYRGVRVLMRRKKNQDRMQCAAYCIDIALRLDPEGAYATKLQNYQIDTGKADWSDMFGKQAEHGDFFATRRNIFKRRSTVILGGTAKSLAATRSQLCSLSARELSTGRHIGATSPITATALQIPNTEGLELQIPQKVGNKTGNSLEKIKKLMRKRHEEKGRIPSSFRIKIEFENQDELLDCSSNEAALAILIDSLFTGRELDKNFGMTGGINPVGGITPVGGIAGKIRSASKKGCQVVGVPLENAQAVRDFFLLDGIKQFSTIQVFSFKTIEVANSVASAKRSESVQKAIDGFKIVAKAIKSKGKAALDDKAIVSQLEDIIAQTPNHQTARLLLDLAGGREIKSLSAGGSYYQINSRLISLRPILRKMIHSDSLTVSTPDRKMIKEVFSDLEKVRPRTHLEVKKYHDSIRHVLLILTRGRNENEDRMKFHSRFVAAWKKAETERKRLKETHKIKATLEE